MTSIAYNAKGQRVLLALGNGMMTRYAYDALTYRLLRIRTEGYVESGGTYTPQSGSTKQDSGYVYDLGGNILKIKERVTDCGISGTTLGADALDRTFAYDPLKRLLQATGRESDTQGNSDHWEEKPAVGSPNANHTRAYVRSYAYDKLGNLLAVGHAADANNYTRHYRYTSGRNLLEQLDNDGSPATVHASYTYDACGNQLTTNSDRYYEWDAADQLRLFKIDAGSGPSVEAHYFYAGGERLKKVVMDQQGNKRVTVYLDGVYEHVYTKDSVGDVQEQQNILHVMDGRSRVATVRVGEKMDDPGEAVKYNLEDHLGTSTTRLTDDGTVIDREEYYPFGESSMRTFEYKRYRYVGKELDSESGLYYYGARYYMAWVGRFVSVDPLAGSYAHLTPYNYAGNSPVASLDIDGLQDPGQPQTPVPDDLQNQWVQWQSDSDSPNCGSWMPCSVELSEFEVSAVGPSIRKFTNSTNLWEISNGQVSSIDAGPGWKPIQHQGAPGFENDLELLTRLFRLPEGGALTILVDNERELSEYEDTYYTYEYTDDQGSPQTFITNESDFRGVQEADRENRKAIEEFTLSVTIATATEGLLRTAPLPKILRSGPKQQSIERIVVMESASETAVALRTMPLLGPGTRFSVKIESQLAKRGWTKGLVKSVISNPVRTSATRDTRHMATGGRMNDPATIYFGRRGGYVVRNDRTGDVVQVSNRRDPRWPNP